MLRYSDDGVYEGEVDDKEEPQGRGEYRWPNGDRYVGEWRSGQREGDGRCVYASGNVYEGTPPSCLAARHCRPTASMLMVVVI